MAWPAAAKVSVPGVISSRMVLQRDIPAPIWGQASPGEKVTVNFRGQSKSTIADEAGNWSVKLDPLKAGGPDTLTIAGTNTIVLEDVLVGEVWLGSGQSNMAGRVAEFAENDPVLAEAMEKEYPQIRFVTAGPTGWKLSTPEENKRFSAQLFAFGTRLQRELNCPLGLMLGAVGGSPSGLWVSQKHFYEDPAVQKSIEDYQPEFEAAQKKAEAEQGEWLKTPEAAQADAKSKVRFPNKPGKLSNESAGGIYYEQRIRPFIPYAIRGVLWDQGESYSGLGGVNQYITTGALIRGWRQDWGQGDFPFLYVQKPSGGGTALDRTNPMTNQASPLGPQLMYGFKLEEMRETFLKLKQYPNTAMVTASDLGAGVHPANKSGYGYRAADVALGFVYKQPREYYGPVYESHKIQGNKIILSFTHRGKGLTVPEGQKLQGFIIAGEDKVFKWGEAVIEGDTVVVSHPQIAQPAAVRYAWSARIDYANLFNKDGLPAQSFRTDSW